MKPSSRHRAALFSIASSAACVAALLSACAAAPPPPPAAPPSAPAAMVAPLAPPPPPTFKCNADGARFAIGKTDTPPLEAAARERSDAELSRVLKPHDMVTMEFNDARLNLMVDDHGKVTAVRCG